MALRVIDGGRSGERDADEADEAKLDGGSVAFSTASAVDDDDEWHSAACPGLGTPEHCADIEGAIDMAEKWHARRRVEEGITFFFSGMMFGALLAGFALLHGAP